MMRGQRSLLFFWLLLYASNGWTRPQGYSCTQREGTSFTVLMDDVVSYRSDTRFKDVLNPLSDRFPCVTRQYTAINLNNAETNEMITNDKSAFLKTIARKSVDYFYRQSHCNQSFFYGLKRALEISPAESIILVLSSGSFADLEYIEPDELNYVYSLLEQKKSQVYIFSYASWYCEESVHDETILYEISSFSYGGFFDIRYVNYYMFLQSFKYLLFKPLNSTVRILNLNINFIEEYTEVFNVTSSLSYLLITGNEMLTLNFTDPNGNSYTFRKNPHHHRRNDHIPRTHVVKSPAAGSWILNARGNSLLFVQILGITELDKSGNCSDSDCHPNATCSEFGGYGECTCKEAFAGDGISCNDIDECQDYYTNNCYYDGKCVNTIGSYTCNCFRGSKYNTSLGCVDIDECADRSLNDCDPVAICTNYYGSYGCTCPNGYYGDGRHCEVDECQQGTPCGSGAECFKYNIGSYSCIDPCSKHTVLNDPWRSTANTYAYDMYGYFLHGDYGLSGWYRFKGEYDQQIPEHCVAERSCGTNIPIWMNGSHPTVSDGIVNRTACPNWFDGCCTQPYNISVKMCPGGFYVYKVPYTTLQGSTFAYCTETNSSCLGVSCAQGEECRIVGTVPGCYCKNSSDTTDGVQPENLSDDLTPQVTCGLEKIEVRFSKCLLEKLGYNTSSLHLRDKSCQGITERRDKRYITFITRPIHNHCGGIVRDNGTEFMYINTVYLTPNSDKGENKDAHPIDFRCSYPLDMEISLATAVGADIAAIFCNSSAPINVPGTANISIKMDLFQDSGYTTPYTDSQVWLNSSSMLYVGVIVTGDTDSSPFVLVMKNCYATPTPDSSSGPRYDIITDQCPAKNDPTLSVIENGESLRGRFSLKVFKFPGESNQIYLHCQVGFCMSKDWCTPWCPSTRSALEGKDNMNNTCTNNGPIN